MGEYILSCSSTADLRQEHLEERNIHYICFHFELAGKQYMDDLGKSMSLADFYEAMAQERTLRLPRSMWKSTNSTLRTF